MEDKDIKLCRSIVLKYTNTFIVTFDHVDNIVNSLPPTKWDVLEMLNQLISPIKLLSLNSSYNVNIKIFSKYREKTTIYIFKIIISTKDRENFIKRLNVSNITFKGSNIRYQFKLNQTDNNNSNNIKKVNNTINLSNLPTAWFLDEDNNSNNNNGISNAYPSVDIVQQVFVYFGTITNIEIIVESEKDHFRVIDTTVKDDVTASLDTLLYFQVAIRFESIKSAQICVNTLERCTMFRGSGGQHIQVSYGDDEFFSVGSMRKRRLERETAILNLKYKMKKREKEKKLKEEEDRLRQEFERQKRERERLKREKEEEERRIVEEEEENRKRYEKLLKREAKEKIRMEKEMRKQKEKEEREEAERQRKLIEMEKLEQQKREEELRFKQEEEEAIKQSLAEYEREKERRRIDIRERHYNAASKRIIDRNNSDIDSKINIDNNYDEDNSYDEDFDEVSEISHKSGNESLSIDEQAIIRLNQLKEWLKKAHELYHESLLVRDKPSKQINRYCPNQFLMEWQRPNHPYYLQYKKKESQLLKNSKNSNFNFLCKAVPTDAYLNKWKANK